MVNPKYTLARFKKTIDDMTREFQPGINCEFSTHKGDLFEKMKYIVEASNKLPNGYHWDMYYCETCNGHDSDYPLHCEIVSINDLTITKD